MSFFSKFKKGRDQENGPSPTGSPPLSCKQVGEDLQSFLDGERTEVSVADLEAHLEACKDCGLEADVYRKIKATLSGRAPQVDSDTIDSLQQFGRQLAESDDS